jgi:hypothetical protein|tara:strand:- start:6936 stop:7115 length:180 start_codon:yes stop_codon:yes gene_type:complete
VLKTSEQDATSPFGDRKTQGFNALPEVSDQDVYTRIQIPHTLAELKSRQSDWLANQQGK